MTRQAQAEGEQFKNNGCAAVAQAARNTLLLVRQQLTAFFDRLLKENLSGALSGDFLTGLIQKAIDKWSPGENKTLEINLSRQDYEQLEVNLWIRRDS